MRDLVSISFRDDGYVWMRVAVDTLELGETATYGLPAGKRYYKYVLIHVEGLMVNSCRSEQVI